MRLSARPIHVGAPRRRGAILMVALVALVVVSAVTAGLLRRSALMHRGAMHRDWALQADWLAESGLARAVARSAADPDYREETWTPSADEMSTAHSARVTIRVTPDEQSPQKRKITVTADYPDREHDRARASRVLNLE